MSQFLEEEGEEKGVLMGEAASLVPAFLLGQILKMLLHARAEIKVIHKSP